MTFNRFLVLLFAVILPVGWYAANHSGNTIYNPPPLERIYPIRDDSASALISLAAIFSPMEERTGWIKLVCAGMTEGGCAYFKDNQASGVWENRFESIGSSSDFVETAIVINEDTEVWKVRVTIFSPGEETTSDVFVLIRRNPDSRWLLDRILSGPGVISQ